MATVSGFAGLGTGRPDDGFFRISAWIMTLVLVGGFTLQLAAGRSSFNAPAIVHAHGIVYFGWVVLYLVQTLLGTRGPIALHRQLGWIAVAWMIAMAMTGIAVIVMGVRDGRAPFFFLPQHFLIANPLVVINFLVLSGAAVVMRRRTDWHRRLHLSAMSVLTAPGFGRLLPMPLLIPYAYQAALVLGYLFPIAGMIADWRRDGRVHPAWWWAMASMIAFTAVTEAIVWSPLGDWLYATATSGARGAMVPGLSYTLPPMP